MIKKLAFVSLILWMIVIFTLSAQVQEKSHNLSTGITKVVVETIERVAPKAEINVKKIHYVIRKNAHFFAYLVLGILSLIVLRCSGMKGCKCILWSLFMCVAYAVSDEIHQAFVPGRGPGLKDVLIDSAGAIVGIALCLCASRVVHKTGKKEEVF